MGYPRIQETATYKIRLTKSVGEVPAMKIDGQWYYLCPVGNPSKLHDKKPVPAPRPR